MAHRAAGCNCMVLPTTKRRRPHSAPSRRAGTSESLRPLPSSALSPPLASSPPLLPPPQHLLVATAQVQGASDVYSDFLEPNVLALRELHEQMETEFSVKIKPSRDLHEQAWRLLQPPVKEYSDLERYYAAPGADRPLEVQRKVRLRTGKSERCFVPPPIVGRSRASSPPIIARPRSSALAPALACGIGQLRRLCHTLLPCSSSLPFFFQMEVVNLNIERLTAQARTPHTHPGQAPPVLLMQQ